MGLIADDEERQRIAEQARELVRQGRTIDHHIMGSTTLSMMRRLVSETRVILDVIEARLNGLKEG